MSPRKGDPLFTEFRAGDLRERLRRRRLYLSNARKRRVDAVRRIRKAGVTGDDLQTVLSLLDQDTMRLQACDSLIDLVQLLDDRVVLEIDILSNEPRTLGFGLDEKGRYPALG